LRIAPDPSRPGLKANEEINASATSGTMSGALLAASWERPSFTSLGGLCQHSGHQAQHAPGMIDSK
jgi:hypothetical protein